MSKIICIGDTLTISTHVRIFEVNIIYGHHLDTSIHTPHIHYPLPTSTVTTHTSTVTTHTSAIPPPTPALLPPTLQQQPHPPPLTPPIPHYQQPTLTAPLPPTPPLPQPPHHFLHPPPRCQERSSTPHCHQPHYWIHHLFPQPSIPLPLNHRLSATHTASPHH